MTAVLLGQQEHSLLELTRTLLMENAAGVDAKFKAVADQGLGEFYWAGVRTITQGSTNSASEQGRSAVCAHGCLKHGP